ncbi:MAG: acyltransferase [Nodosilinea sp. LVE1205-7]|jgi:acetyltransferase-like isoleucine patch superfamily enzyme
MTPLRLDHDWFPDPLPANIDLGERNWLCSSFAFRHYQSQRPLGLTTGHDTGIYSNSFFHLGPRGQVTIGNYCTLVGVIVCTNGSVVIGDYSFISHEVVLADTYAATPFSARCRPEDTSTSPDQPAILIGKNVWIGAQAILLAGAQIGEGAIVGAGCVVAGAVPAYSIVAGNPPRLVGQLPRPQPDHPDGVRPDDNRRESVGQGLGREVDP